MAGIGGGGGGGGAPADVEAQLRQVLMDAAGVAAAAAEQPERPEPPEEGAGEEEEEEEETTAEFEVELTDAQTWAMNFYECAAEGDLECLEEILDSGKVGVDDVDVDGFTALMIAAAEGHGAVVRALLARGADTDVRTHELRSTALHFAAKHGDAEIVEAICAKSGGVDYWNTNEDTPLIWACIEGRVDAARVLLAHGADTAAVNHYGAPALLCAVMIGENPDEDASDSRRAEILRLLLDKNAAPVNFQDREGSTAMHLAASCGYLECVKTLLAFGADITLRNAIGQTPLEEAELSDLRGSSECVAHLRVIWRQLEEEASARMIAMLEMEDGTGVGTEGARASSKKSKKKHKHKSGKRKAATAAKTQVPASDGATAGGDTSPSEEDGPVAAAHSDQQVANVDDRGDVAAPAQVQSASDVNSGDEDSDSDADVDRPTKSVSAEIPASGRADDPPTLGRALVTEATQGVWTTVGRKHRGASVSAGGSVDSKPATFTRSGPQSHHKSPSNKGADAKAPHSLSTRPTRVVSKEAASVTARPVGNAHRDGSGQAPRSQPAAKISAAPPMPQGAAPSRVTSRSAVPALSSSGYSQGLVGAAPMWQQGVVSGAFRLQPPSQLQSSLLPAHAGSLYGPAAASSLGYLNRFGWKHGYVHHHYPSHYYYYQNHQQSARVGAQGFAREATTRWIGKLHLGNAAVADSLSLLACGHCGELVDDNLQCGGDLSSTVAATGGDSSTRNVCTQLYCSSCVARVSAGAEHFTCVKCRHSVARGLMRRNEFAQQQAASLALSINHSGLASDAGASANASSRLVTIDGMQRALFAAVARAEAADLGASDLVPGASDLSKLSNGQLEVLDAAHAAARQAIVDQQMANARALEREQLLEWLKLHHVALPAQFLTPSVFSTRSTTAASSMAMSSPAAGALSSTPSSMDSWQA